VRLRDRQLYKCIDVRERLLTKLGEDAKEEVVERACQKVDATITEWLASKIDVAPRIITDRAEREPYKRFQESKGPLNQIRIKTSGGELVDLVKRSKVVAAISTFKLYRVYVSDAEARQFVEQTIDTEGSNGSTG
jgi:HD superfamily phosphohydrolase